MQIDDIEIADAHVLHVGRMNVVLRTRHGVLVLNRYSPIGRSVCFYGEHAEQEIAFCSRFLAPGSSVLDIGAHQGTHSLAFARCVGPSGMVVAVEPQRIMLQNIYASASLNDFDTIRPVHAAIGSAEGSVRIRAFDYRRRAHFSGMRISEENDGETVRLRSIDEIAASVDVLRPIALVKIDIEGMELQALEGARRILTEDRPVVYLEYRGNQVEQIAGFLDEIGYCGWLHRPSGFNPANFYGYTEDRFAGNVDENAVFVAQDLADRSKRIRSMMEGLPSIKPPMHRLR